MQKQFVTNRGAKMKYYFRAFEKYAKSDGRASRKEYWWFILFHYLVIFILSILDNILYLFPENISLDYGYLTLIYLFASACPAICLQVRRLHDIGKSGGLWLLKNIPIISYYILYLNCKAGEPGINDYGAPSIFESNPISNEKEKVTLEIDNTKTSPQLGTKWFTFYTKIRPWFACVMFLPTLVDFIEYIDTYLSVWWMLLAFAASVAQCVLSIMVFIKSQGDYVEFVRFVKGVLLFETIAVPYHQGVQQYINNDFDFGIALVVFIIILVLAFFLWYRLNVKYFEKRINTVDSISQSEVYSDETPESRYCTNCGNKLVENSNFCGKCGAPIWRK